MEIASRHAGHHGWPVVCYGGFVISPRLRGQIRSRVVADAALVRLEVDAHGLDAMDRRYLSCMADPYSGGPVGVETLAAVLSEQRDVLEEVIEPYLMQTGLLMRTPRGRCLSAAGWGYLGLTPPAAAMRQLDLLWQLTIRPGLTSPIKTKVMCD